MASVKRVVNNIKKELDGKEYKKTYNDKGQEALFIRDKYKCSFFRAKKVLTRIEKGWI